jgi:formylglycine-generating enzyme required for sulfatase activity
VVNQPAFHVQVVPTAAGPDPAAFSPSPPGADSDQGPTKVVPRGLRSFDAEDADFFLELLPGPCNRDGLPESIRFWKTRIETTDPEKTFRVGLLYGPSGCGKSSLVKAGLLPRLADTVRPLYVEATSADTEARLLRGLRKRFPGLAENPGLVETLASLRRARSDRIYAVAGQDAPMNRGTKSGQKVLLVIDQFEQWLHAWKGEQDTELVQALRQCDGEHLLCLVLVRDDFGMAATRFLHELEVPIVQGENFATVDLFDPRHARKVLTEFGRAFGCLPEKRGELSPSHEQFLDQAVAGLAQDGKVISVRLALFTEMVKGKPWTPATLRQVGGIEGLGVTFLEETFGSRAGNPEHRLHQRAARAVLKSLLPEQGTDIRGHTRSHQQLLEASGYARRPQSFEGLLRILDTDLRLITPADPEGLPGEDDEPRGDKRPRLSTLAKARQPTSEAACGYESKYYQLTHDYLVPALRQWLTRKQRETRRGRMELLLAERVALWSVKKETRQLPGWWEWGKILLFTQHKDRTAPQRQMLRAAARKHLVQAGVLVVLLAVIGWAVFAVIQGPLKASALVRQLASAETVNVPKIIEELSSCRPWADDQLREMVKRYPDGSKQRLHASLALLPVDPEQKNYLYDRLVKAKDPDELMVICEALVEQKHYQEIVPRLWAENEPDRRFRAACALATFDAKDPRWESKNLSDEVANRLVQENPGFANRWSIVLIRIRSKLFVSLERIMRDPERPKSERSLAAERLMMYFHGRIDLNHFMDLVLEADGRVYKVLLDFFMVESEEAAKVVKKELARELPPTAFEKEKDDLAKRQAHAAVVLFQLDQSDRDILHLHQATGIREMLRQSPDSRKRAYLIHRLSRAGIKPETLLKQYEVEKDGSVRQALLLSLGEFDSVKLPNAGRKELIPRLLGDYRADPDAGIHSAVDWLLRRWQQGPALRKIDQELAGGPPNKRRWYVTKSHSHTLAVFSGPLTFSMGSPHGQPKRADNEKLHPRRIPRSFALATKEVTVKQFQEFLQANPDVAAGFRKRVGEKNNPDPEGPVVGVTWLEAAQYCQWLSEQEGVPKEQRCYPSVAEIEKSKDGKTPLKLPANYLMRTGYRLPTEAEWEYACRAGATTSRHYGVADALLGDYAWYVGNSRGRTRPVGTKMPNDFGLFDMYGNAWEWCQDAFVPYSAGSVKEPIEDKESKDPITPSVDRVLRGGAIFSPASEVRSASRFGFQPHLPLVHAGLRVARTMSPNNSSK